MNVTTPATPDGVLPELPEPSSETCRNCGECYDAYGIAQLEAYARAALEQREAEVMRWRAIAEEQRLTIGALMLGCEEMGGTTSVLRRLGDLENRAAAAESRLGEAERLLRDSLHAMRFVYDNDCPAGQLKGRITDFFKGAK